MEYSTKTRALTSLLKDIDDKSIVLSHKLQRKEGQWNRSQKSDLIDSLLRGYPINPTYAVKDDNIWGIIDGVQRLSSIRDFCRDVFALSKNAKNVVINGKEKEIAKKKFSKLDEETRDFLMKQELQIYLISDYTENDVREMFKRLNGGTSLSKSQKSVTELSDELLEKLNSVLSHEFWSKTALTTGQIKKDEDRDVLLEALMLMSEYDIQGFKSEHIYYGFVPYLDTIDCDALFTRVNTSIIKLDEIITEKKKSLKKLSVPFVIYSMDKVLKNKSSVTKYSEWLNKFLDEYETNEEYRKLVNTSGTASKESVLGRKEYFKKIVNSL